MSFHAKFLYVFYHHSNTMTRSFFPSFYKMTHDPKWPFEKESCGRTWRTVPIDMTEIWIGNWTGKGVVFFKEAGEWIFRGTYTENGCFGTLICPWNKAGKCIFQSSRNPKTQDFPSASKYGGASGRHYIKQIIHQS